MNQPKFSIGSLVYLRESAAIGHLEAVRVNGIHIYNTTWLYTTTFSRDTSINRVSTVNKSTLYYSEDEFVSYCDATILAEAYAKRMYDKLKQHNETICDE